MQQRKDRELLYKRCTALVQIADRFRIIIEKTDTLPAVAADYLQNKE